MSLVARVMSDAVENRSISALENARMRSYICSRRSRPTPADTREAIKPTAIAVSIMSRDMSTILPPMAQR